jgi:hypothetical protein
MAIDIRTIKKLCPNLVLDSKEKEMPIDVEKSLDTASLKKENGFATLMESIDLNNPAILQSFRNFCETETGLYVHWKLLDKTVGVEKTLNSLTLKNILKQSNNQTGYYVVAEKPGDVAHVKPGYKKVMEGHYIISYAFYFPSMNGYPFDAAPTTHESRWTAFSLLVNKTNHKPVYAGFHGTDGVRVLGVADHNLTGSDSIFDCYVSLGCHSIFEAPGKYEFRYNSGISVITAALSGDSSSNDSFVCVTNEMGEERCEPMNDDDATIIILAGLLILLITAITKAMEDDETPEEVPNEDPNSDLEVEPAALEEEDGNIEVEITDIIMYETNDGAGAVIKPMLIDAKSTSWWKYDQLKWGDQDITALGLERFDAGPKRPDFVAEFLDKLVLTLP